jgi:2OG-Fe(II) oxygenase superfamily
MLQIAAKGVQIDNAPDVVAELRRQFNAFHVLVFPQALEPEHLASLQSLLSRSQFEPRQVPKVGDQEIESPAVVARALSFSLGHRALIGWINQITGSTVSRHLTGGLARHRADPLHQLAWHDDHLDAPVRQLAITMNLSSTAYEGGDFEMRYKGHEDILFSHHHGEPGSLLLFRVDRRLEHRVTAVASGGPRLVYAGWFA